MERTTQERKHAYLVTDGGLRALYPAMFTTNISGKHAHLAPLVYIFKIFGCDIQLFYPSAVHFRLHLMQQK